MALLKRELYRQVKGPEITHADRCTLVFDTDAKNLYVEREVAHLDASVDGVKWFNPAKGFGFIQPDSGGKDVFVHISAVERAGLSTLNEGQKITYEVQQDRGKDAAVNLKA